jgi:hypothetical protein
LLGVGGVTGDTVGQALRIYNSLPTKMGGATVILLPLFVVVAVVGAYLQLYGAWVFILGTVFGIVGGWAVGTKLLPHIVGS